MTEYLSAAETAKLVRAALKREFPGVKFSVRSSTYAGGASVHVHWTDGPQTAEVDKVAKPYSGSSFDSMADMKVSRSHWLSPDGTVQVGVSGEAAREGARLVHFGADYVFTERSFGPAYRESLEQAVVLLSGEEGPFDGNRRYEFGVIPEGEYSSRAYCDYGSTLVYQLSQVEPERLASALRAEAKRRAHNAAVKFNREHAGDRTGYYVTVMDGSRVGALLGPYASKAEAEADVPEGERLAKQVNDRAGWYAYGVTKVTMKPGADLPAGKLEDLTERQMALAAGAVPQAA